MDALVEIRRSTGRLGVFGSARVTDYRIGSYVVRVESSRIRGERRRACSMQCMVPDHRGLADPVGLLPSETAEILLRARAIAAEGY